MLDAFLRFCHRFERRVSSSVLAVVAGLLFLAGVVGVANADSATNSAQQKAVTVTTTSTSSTTVTTTIATRATPDGFRAASFAVTPSGGAPENHCGMLADTNDNRARGLMGQDNMRGYDGMLFVFPEDVASSFYMANVKFPLSVAWFDGNGNFVSSADMEVCAVAANDCPRYAATGPYKFALETSKGGLSNLHIGQGSTITIGSGGSCA